MPKRLCPFNGSYPQIKTHVDMRLVGKEAYAKEVYEKTTKMLMEGALQARKVEQRLASEKENLNSECDTRGKKNLGPVFKVLKEKLSSCYYCKANLKLTPTDTQNACSYCNKSICTSNCSRDCAYCGQTVCPSCYKIDYEAYDERLICVTCADNVQM